MSLSPKLQKALNEQVNAEFQSSYLYLSMADFMTSKNMPGCAHWMRMQAREELLHAVKLQDFILERQAPVKLGKIDAPQDKWSSVIDVFKAAYKHEQSITKKINVLLELAISEKDRATENVLRWFIDEQVEEEATLDELLSKLKMVGDGGSGMFILDNELGSRSKPESAAA